MGRHSYTINQIDKLGNAIIFLCQRINDGKQVSKTHILKLVFILEELSIAQSGIPFFGLRFDVWKLGPVAPDLYLELSEEPNLLAPYISLSATEDRTEVLPLRPFSDDEFSDHEMALLEKVADRFKYCTAKELINFTHRKGTPWYNAAQKHGLLETLESGKMNTTNIEVDLSSVIANDPSKLELYTAHQQHLLYTQSLK